MNIYIGREEHEYLQTRIIHKFLMGSRLYGTSGENSDTDFLCIYRTSDEELFSGLPNFHQFQYKETEKNTDWIYCSELQFRKNLYSGDSTINADIVLFTGLYENKLSMCRTYKIIRAYVGFARRDLKQAHKEPGKINHAKRGLYCAEQLLDNQLPEIEKIQELYKEEHKVEEMVNREQGLRARLNRMYDNKELENYYIEDCGDPLWQKLLNSNNIREFRY